MIEITDKKQCCGCTACASICPKSCIEMKRDIEGFEYPDVDKTKCVDCHLCEKVCPIINEREDNPIPQRAFIVQHKDDNIRLDSSSGGAFTAIAEYVLDNDGVVFGVQYDEDMNVVHTYIENKNDIYKYRNSKYVQSKLGNSFVLVKNFLESGRLVCFSGTPCQVEGLRHYLMKDYENLILVDLICHAVPSPLVWEKYRDNMKQRYGDISNIRFRDKYYGYRYSTLSIFTKDRQKAVYHEGIDTDFMLRAFFSNICNRPSCYNCRFKKRYRSSDFTIWDCFNIRHLCKNMDDNMGTTRVLIHSSKGRDIFKEVSARLNCHELDPDILVKDVKEMKHSVDENPKRNEFMREVASHDVGYMSQKYFTNSAKAKIEKYIRITLCKMGIYDLLKDIAKKIIKEKSRM